MRIRLLLALISLFVGVAAGAAAGAATFDVTNLDDSGPGSLRQAMIDANASPGADTIDFDAGLSGVLELESALPTLTESVNVFGTGMDTVTIDANQHGRVFDLLGNSTSSFNFFQLSITGGLAETGAGLHVRGQDSLLLDNVRVFDNTATDDYGGGIAGNLGTFVTVYQSLVDGNTARRGAGVFSSGEITVDQSSILWNVATSELGAEGGGVWCSDRLIIQESTIDGNRAVSESPSFFGYGGGINAYVDCVVTIYQSTISRNVAASGSGVRLWIDADVTDTGGSLFAYNVTETGFPVNCSEDLGAVDRKNLSSDDTCGFTGSLDFTDTDPSLMPILWAGGPTPTAVLRPGSPAIDQASGFCINIDQRGFSRPVDGDGNGSSVCDIGATEYTPGVDEALFTIFENGFESGDTSVWSQTVN